MTTYIHHAPNQMLFQVSFNHIFLDARELGEVWVGSEPQQPARDGDLHRGQDALLLLLLAVLARGRITTEFEAGAEGVDCAECELLLLLRCRVLVGQKDKDLVRAAVQGVST